MGNVISIKHANGNGPSFQTQINPSSIKITKKVAYDTQTFFGSDQFFTSYNHHEPSRLSFEIYLDDTGAISNVDGKLIGKRIQELEEAVYLIQQNKKEPGWVNVVWGSIDFKGRAESIDYDYILFNTDGSPLRVKISLSFIGSFEKEQSKQASYQNASVVSFSSGDSLTTVCHDVYGDSSYSLEVAVLNGLSSLRNIPAGTTIILFTLSR